MQFAGPRMKTAGKGRGHLGASLPYQRVQTWQVQHTMIKYSDRPYDCSISWNALTHWLAMNTKNKPTSDSFRVIVCPVWIIGHPYGDSMPIGPMC